MYVCIHVHDMYYVYLYICSIATTCLLPCLCLIHCNSKIYAARFTYLHTCLGKQQQIRCRIRGRGFKGWLWCQSAAQAIRSMGLRIVTLVTFRVWPSLTVAVRRTCALDAPP